MVGRYVSVKDAQLHAAAVALERTTPLDELYVTHANANRGLSW